mgnify:CR=1 FL=1
MANSVIARRTVSASVNGREVGWEEVDVDFDNTGDTFALVVNATNFPNLLGTGRYSAGSRVAWFWVARANLGNATGTFTPTVDSTTRRLLTLPATAAADGYDSSLFLERAPVAFIVASGDTLTIDRGDAGGASIGVVTSGIGPSGVI